VPLQALEILLHELGKLRERHGAQHADDPVYEPLNAAAAEPTMGGTDMPIVSQPVPRVAIRNIHAPGGPGHGGPCRPGSRARKHDGLGRHGPREAFARGGGAAEEHGCADSRAVGGVHRKPCRRRCASGRRTRRLGEEERPGGKKPVHEHGPMTDTLTTQAAKPIPPMSSDRSAATFPMNQLPKAASNARTWTSVGPCAVIDDHSRAAVRSERGWFPR